MSVGAAGVQGLAEVTFYSKWRLGEVERCVLRLLAAARRKLHGGTSDPYQVCSSIKKLGATHLASRVPSLSRISWTQQCLFDICHDTLCRSSRCKSQLFNGQTTTHTPQTSGGELFQITAYRVLTRFTTVHDCRMAACRIFSSERGPEGKRCFIATTLEAFWKRYRDMLPQHRHCYEIIRHGYPCHLYFGAAACCAL